ncbi:hypothetical protein LSH36_396g00001 [Paralvinella palmiformis]|uniref:Uncharacterized protein n=1 Tax=Paralvinella palmiformis TaxID=53620 RepID=A0AAD9JCJ3_9ANNE|nr:hypothetical protein LSH36_396g00001 [Paralvinella palmiformis]
MSHQSHSRQATQSETPTAVEFGSRTPKSDHLQPWSLGVEHQSQITSVVEERTVVRKVHPRHTEPVPPAPCGEVCTYSGTEVNASGMAYPELHKDINCKNIMNRMAYRNYTVEDPPPDYPPESLIPNFTMNGAMPITKRKYFSSGSSTATRVFTASYIQNLISKVNEGEQVNGYKAGKCMEDTLKRYGHEINGKRGVVIGTLQPWLEAILLAYGAIKVTTLEYTGLELEDGRIEVFTPYDFADHYLGGESVELFDFGATFSSLEHSGLGRYTDPLNPYGDLEAMAQTWCMIKPGGLFVLGLPCSMTDDGFILWNANRMYGTKRLQQMTANWRLLEVVRCTDANKLFVLRKPAQQQQQEQQQQLQLHYDYSE